MVELLRFAAVLALFVVGSGICYFIAARIGDTTSMWLCAFVFLLSLSAGIGVLHAWQTSEPLHWYGAPLRLIAALCGAVYIVRVWRRG